MVHFVFSAVPYENVDKLNVNNLWDDDKPPDDYQETLEATSFDKYIDAFHSNYFSISLAPNELEWISEAFHLEKICNRFSNIFEDDLEALIEHHKVDFKNEKYFIRTAKCSLKTGKYRAGPYTSMRNIITSMVTSDVAHNPIDKTLYFIPWLDLNFDLEFRVFIYKGNIKGISQQHLYHINPTLSKMSLEDKEKLFENLVDKIKESQLKITHINTYTMDIGFTISKDVYFIELNPFGAKYSAGSSLFHWVDDYDILCNDDDDSVIYVKYVQ